MTVSGNGSDFVFDLVTDNGKKVKATFNGKVNVVDFFNPDNVPEYPSTLTGNVDFKVTEETVALSYNLGDYIKEGLYQFMVMLTEPEMLHGDYLALELSAGAEVLPDGTYTINNALEPFTGIKGETDYGGNILYSWYSDLDSADEEGYQTVICPVEGGTVTISTVADGRRKIVLDLNDGKGHTISGEYVGVLYNLGQDAAKGRPAMKTPAMQAAPAISPVVSGMKLIR